MVFSSPFYLPLLLIIALIYYVLVPPRFRIWFLGLVSAGIVAVGSIWSFVNVLILLSVIQLIIGRINHSESERGTSTATI